MRNKIDVKRFNEQYFTAYIAREQNRMIKFENKLSNGEVREDRILPVKKEVFRIMVDLLLAKYSLGTDVSELEGDFKRVVENLLPNCTYSDDYYTFIWILAMCVLFDPSDDCWETFILLKEKFSIQDWLYNFLLSYHFKDNDYKNLEIRVEDPYIKIKDLVEGQSNYKGKIRLYLDEFWYNGHDDRGWYDIHKSKQDLYSGYWSFEAGAVAKILQIDDEELKDQPYYPYDLVHYKG